MTTSRDDDPLHDDGGGWLYLLGRIASRLLQAWLVIVVVGTVALLLFDAPHQGEPKERPYIGAMKSDLRNLVTAQEAYFADHRVYAPSLWALGPNHYSTSAGVTVWIDRGTSAGFAASATHSGTHYRCAIFVGPSTVPREVARPGAPVCWPGPK